MVTLRATCLVAKLDDPVGHIKAVTLMTSKLLLAIASLLALAISMAVSSNMLNKALFILYIYAKRQAFPYIARYLLICTTY